MKIIQKYFKGLSKEQLIQFTKLEVIYKDWNSKINVISRKDIDELYLRHVLHSLSIAKLISFKDGTSILDVGTGGGFPGIPLAILFPNCKFHLVDSIQKKINVVNNVVKELDLKNVKTSSCRVEAISEKNDFVVSRAVTNMKDFVSWIKFKINKISFNDFKNGVLYLKGGDLNEELKSFKNVKTFELSEFFNEDFFNEKKVVYLPIKYKTKN
ncbi:16S rRNA (guanine(527)-N(7))-methyltransferase RsmG [Flavobacteriaceae bacterium]|jgi:16S rRNA (guanine527-N7)-methyltransferase|nr:16S rRNA (guanine(527)-N(7))-methyltransferase RsmG [Flavobacteriaceae bacterium]